MPDFLDEVAGTTVIARSVTTKQSQRVKTEIASALGGPDAVASPGHPAEVLTVIPAEAGIQASFRRILSR